MEKRRVASACILSLILIIGGALAQAQVAVTVEGLDGAKTTYTLDQLRQMTQQSVAATNSAAMRCAITSRSLDVMDTARCLL